MCRAQPRRWLSLVARAARRAQLFTLVPLRLAVLLAAVVLFLLFALPLLYLSTACTKPAPSSATKADNAAATPSVARPWPTLGFAPRSVLALTLNVAGQPRITIAAVSVFKSSRKPWQEEFKGA